MVFYICGLLFLAAAVFSAVTQCELQCYLKSLQRIYIHNVIWYYCTLFNRIMEYGIFKKEKAGLGKTNQARKFTCLILVILFILNLTKVRNCKLKWVLLNLNSSFMVKIWSGFNYFCWFKLFNWRFSLLKW